MRRDENLITQKILNMNAVGLKDRERWKKTGIDYLKNDMHMKGVNYDVTGDKD